MRRLESLVKRSNEGEILRIIELKSVIRCVPPTGSAEMQNSEKFRVIVEVERDMLTHGRIKDGTGDSLKRLAAKNLHVNSHRERCVPNIGNNVTVVFQEKGNPPIYDFRIEQCTIASDFDDQFGVHEPMRVN